MSMITEQVEYLIKLSNKNLYDSNIPTLQRACKEAAYTIETLSAKVRKENGFIFPENPTNGDVIKALYLNDEFTVKDYYQAERSIVVICNKDNSMEFDPIWWNSPYKRGDTE